MNQHTRQPQSAKALQKWRDPDWTASGQRRATVPLVNAKGRGAATLWFNTGTLCNIECVNCYIESSPENDRLVYLTNAEIEPYLDEIAQLEWPTTEIAFTGGEPFMNPDMLAMTQNALERGYEVLILTNAMRPMMRPKIQKGLLDLRARYGDRLTLRVSLDHYTPEKHDEERGSGSFAIALEGLRWLAKEGFNISLAGRTLWSEPEAVARIGYAGLIDALKLNTDATDPAALVLFPEMDEDVPVPEISTGCWDILGLKPSAIMCASSRMVVKRKGAARPSVLACTLIPYEQEFEMGETLEEASRAVKLNHPHCAKFCVLGGASCSG